MKIHAMWWSSVKWVELTYSWNVILDCQPYLIFLEFVLHDMRCWGFPLWSTVGELEEWDIAGTLEHCELLTFSMDFLLLEIYIKLILGSPLSLERTTWSFYSCRSAVQNLEREVFPVPWRSGGGWDLTFRSMLDLFLAWHQRSLKHVRS